MKSYKEDNRPSLQFYPDDWLSDSSLRLCSLEARGLWIDMLMIMFKANVRGQLTVNGVVISSKMLAKIIGDTEENITKLIKELEQFNVFSRLEDGVIINRRMYYIAKRKRDLHEVRVEAGRKGGSKQKPSKKEAKQPSSSPPPTSSSTSIPPPKINFVRFWDLYNFKKARLDCEDYWNGKKRLKTRKFITEEDRELCIETLPVYVKNTNKDGVYPSRKDPKTYLYNSSWLDEVISNEKQEDINADHVWSTYTDYFKQNKEDRGVLDPLISKAFKLAGVTTSGIKLMSEDTVLKFARPKVEKIYRSLVKKGE